MLQQILFTAHCKTSICAEIIDSTLDAATGLVRESCKGKTARRRHKILLIEKAGADVELGWRSSDRLFSLSKIKHFLNFVHFEENQFKKKDAFASRLLNDKLKQLIRRECSVCCSLYSNRAPNHITGRVLYSLNSVFWIEPFIFWSYQVFLSPCLLLALVRKTLGVTTCRLSRSFIFIKMQYFVYQSSIFCWASTNESIK